MTSERSKTPKQSKARDTQNYRHVKTDTEITARTAFTNIKVRTELYKLLGILSAQAAFLSKYLGKDLTDRDFLRIEDYINQGISRYGQPSLENANKIYVVALQITALKKQKLTKKEREVVDSMFEGASKIPWLNRQSNALFRKNSEQL